jgi:integrase
VGAIQDFSGYYLNVLGRKPSTTARQCERLRSWERVAGKPVTEITSLDVLSYLEHNPLGHAGNTRKGMLSAIQAFHRYEAAYQLKTLNGICDIATPSIADEDSPPPLPLRFVRPLMEACSRPLEYRVIYGGFFLGLRIGESGYLHGAMWSDGCIWIKGEKTNRTRTIPVHSELDKVMWNLLAHPPTDAATMQRVKRRLAKRTGISFVSHQLRKRFAQSLADAGVDKGTRADLLGHRTVDDLYATPSLSTLRDAISRLAY